MEAPEQTKQTGSPDVSPSERNSMKKRSWGWNTVFPEPIGVALVFTLLIALVGVSVFTHSAMQRQYRGQSQTKGRTVAKVMATALGRVAHEDAEAVKAILQQMCAKTHSIRRIAWVAPDGAVRCQWPLSLGALPPNSSGAEGSISLTEPIMDDAGAAAGTLQMELAFVEPSQTLVLLLRGAAAAGVLTLLVFFALYRRLRRHLRPMEAIKRNLDSFAAGTEKEFTALSLSDSLGQIAGSWNHLIDQLATLRDQEADSGAADLAGDAMRRFESRTLRSTLDRMPVGLLRFGPDQVVSYTNVAAGRLLGLAKEDLLDKQLADVLEEEVRAPLVGAFMRAGAGMSVDRKRGSEEQQTTLRFSMIPSGTASPDREALVMIEDVSHLQEAERARDNFLYHVTHELRTPLTNIQAYAETLTGPGFDDEQTRRECYNVIISETRRLSRLVEDILNISQLEVGTARIEMGQVDLVRLIRQIVQDHLGAADEKQIDLTLKLAPKVPKVRGDKQRLSVLITNLVGNAIKYTPEGGHVDVVVEVSEQCVRVVVADTGIGIAPEDQTHVFDKFYRAVNDEVQMITGTGLGLAIAREVARLHGGDIHLESELTKGSKFVVELPHCETEE